MSKVLRSFLRLTVATGTAAAAAVVLLRAGRRLPGPPLDPRLLAVWASDLGTAAATFAVLRLLGLALVVYLAACFGLAGVGAVLHVPGLVRAADRLSFGAVTRLAATSAVSVLLSTTAMSGAGATPGPGATDNANGAASAVVMRLLAGDEAGSATPTSTVTPADPAPVVMRLVTANGPVAQPALASALSPEPVLPGTLPADLETTARRSSGNQSGDEVRTYLVRPGDHLWSIAQQALTGDPAAITTGSGAGTTDVDDAATERYWLRLIDANRSRLADPSNPDLLFAGQQLMLPTPTP